MTRAKKGSDYPFNKIEKIKSIGNNNCVLCFYDKPVGWINAITKKKQSIPNIAFFGYESSDIYIVNKILDSNNKVIVHFADYYQHSNIYSIIVTSDIIIEDKKYIVYYQKMCTGDNAISGYQLYDNPEIATLTLGTIINGQYNGSPANTNLKSADNFSKDYLDNLITPDAGMLSLLLNKPISQISIIEKRNFLVNLPDKGYYVKLVGGGSYTYYKTKAEFKDIQVSKYFPAFTVAQIKEEIGIIPKISKDLICLGLGSAGSGILEQLARTNMVNDFLLVDFDIVEEKNLRNQFYVTSQIGNSKAQKAHDSMKYFNSNNKVESYNKKFQELNWDFFKSKYIVLGFDSIKTRLEALDYIKSGKIEAQYIIDTRYEGLEASIYFIDTSDKEQMKYYEEQLISDGELLEEPDTHIYDGTEEYFESLVKECRRDCILVMRSLNMKKGSTATSKVCGYCTQGCGGEMCVHSIVTMLNKAQVSEQKVKELLDGGTSCVRWNIIDIYKYASSFVTSAIREIEEKRPQPFIHIEATTDRLPASMVMRVPVDKKELCGIM